MVMAKKIVFEIIAVSYTHLDVYKRQTQYCAHNQSLNLKTLRPLQSHVYMGKAINAKW